MIIMLPAAVPNTALIIPISGEAALSAINPIATDISRDTTKHPPAALLVHPSLIFHLLSKLI